ncbi:MAG: acetylxylan esterase [Bacteroidales bacterium]|nr:acetylxylan esterase [Candidatus Cacconaster merdequi]
MKRFILVISFLALTFTMGAQQARQYVTPYAEPDHQDWVYKCGETAQVKIYAICENRMMPNVEIKYSYGPEKLKANFEGSVITGKDGYATIKVPGRREPGFTTIRTSIDVNGKNYTGMTNLGYEPYNIKPTTSLPDDFTEFWEGAKAKAAEVPMVTKIRRDDNQSTPTVDVYYVKIQSYRRGNYVYGVLSVPTEAKYRNADGKMPAVLRLPGATVRAFNGPNDLASRGFIVLEIGVHGIPVDQDPEIYGALVGGSLSGYATMGLDSRDTFYYKRVYMGCIRAIDYLCSREDVDTDRIAVYGGSQGGMLSIVTASLDKRVKAMVCQFPAFCDVTGYYYGRSGGWPHLFIDKKEPNIEARINTSKYYDVVNFARFLTIPGYYAWGFNDIVCCPSSTFSAYNVITSPKRLEISRDSGHWLYPWFVEEGIKWLKNEFKMEE